MDNQEIQSAEEAIQSLQYMQQVYQGQYSEISRDISATMDYINDFNATKAALEKYEKITGAQILSPIGSIAFVSAAVSQDKKIMLNVGASYLVETDTGEALEYINAKIKKYSASLQETLKARAKIEDMLFEISMKLNKILTQA